MIPTSPEKEVPYAPLDVDFPGDRTGRRLVWLLPGLRGGHDDRENSVCDFPGAVPREPDYGRGETPHSLTGADQRPTESAQRSGEGCLGGGPRRFFLRC